MSQPVLAQALLNWSNSWLTTPLSRLRPLPYDGSMIGLLTIVAIGFFLGMRHATDPDHVIAVSTILSREGQVKRSALIGAAWGVGHTLTILLVGSAMIVFRIALPPRLGLTMELAVGLMLIFLGIRNLGGLLSWPAQQVKSALDEQRPHYHAHGDYVHVHSHAQEHDPQQTPVAFLDRWFKGVRFYLWVRPLLIGIVHGLAGSAAIALLVLSTISSVRWAILYLLVFGIGTILGMVVITMTIGCTFVYGQNRFPHIGHYFGWAAGLISVAFGLFIAYRISFLDGLFAAHVHWIPR
jgi:high-affinity nickel-transport protein